MKLAVTQDMHFKNVLQLTYNPLSHEIIVLRTNLSALYIQVFNTMTSIAKRIPLEINALDGFEVRGVTHIFGFSYSGIYETFTIIARVTVKGADFEQQMWILNFDNKGQIKNKKRYEKLDSRYLYLMEDYLVDENLVSYNLNSLKETDLSDFFDNFFDTENLFYLRTNEDRCELYTNPSENLLGLSFFDKDGDFPSGIHSIFKIENIAEPELLFCGKVDDFGNRFSFNWVCKKFVYFHYLDFGQIEIIVRELSAEQFEYASKFSVTFPKDNSVPIKLAISDSGLLLLIFYDKIEVYNVLGRQIASYERDFNSAFYFSGNILYYIFSDKLHFQHLTI